MSAVKPSSNYPADRSAATNNAFIPPGREREDLSPGSLYRSATVNHPTATTYLPINSPVITQRDQTAAVAVARSLLNSFSVARCTRPPPPPFPETAAARACLLPSFNYLEYARRIRRIATRSRHPRAPRPHNQISVDSFSSAAADRKLRYDEYFPRASRAGTIAA